MRWLRKTMRWPTSLIYSKGNTVVDVEQRGMYLKATLIEKEKSRPRCSSFVVF